VTELIRLSAADLADKIHKREVSSVEVTQAHLDRIAEVDGAVHAFLHVNTEGALAAAANRAKTARVAASSTARRERIVNPYSLCRRSARRPAEYRIMPPETPTSRRGRTSSV